MKKIKDFIKASHLPPSLISAVVKQLGGWDNFKESANDVVKVGAMAGFGGFVYYSDTVAFYRKNKKSINQALDQMAADLGETKIGLVKSFNCLEDATEDEIGQALYSRTEDYQVPNALAWFALEEVCRSYCDLI